MRVGCGQPSAFGRPGVVAVAAAVLSAAAGVSAGTIGVVPEVYSGAQNLPSVSVVWEESAPSDTLDQFDITLLFADTQLTLVSAFLPETETDQWRLDFTITSVDSLVSGHSVIRLHGVRRSPETDLREEAVLARVLFRPVQPLEGDGRLPVTFYWDNCRTNYLYFGGSKTFEVAERCVDPDGADVTSLMTPPPTVSGVCDECLVGMRCGDTSAVRALTFESTRLPLDVATGVEDDYQRVVPASAVLDQNYPNPFNAGTTIRFDLVARSRWRIELYSVTGQLVRAFAGEAQSGTAAVYWDGRNRSGAACPSGVYFYRLTAGEAVKTRRMVLLR